MARRKHPCVYILTNPRRTVLYVGVTSNLPQRVAQHRDRIRRCFTSRYNVTMLVYWETWPTMRAAIAREKQFKAGSRQQKVALVEFVNPQWLDLDPSLRGPIRRQANGPEAIP